MLMKLRTMLKKQKGFTLIELLVVISIIGVLAAVAVPRFMESTASAKTAKVQADLGAIDTAIQVYAASHAGVVPVYTTGEVGTALTGTNGALPVPPTGNFRIGGATGASVVTYGIDAATGRATATITGTGAGTYTADTLNP